MELIKVNKTELLSALKENRSKHRTIFENAQMGYRKKAIELLDKALQDAREGREITTFIQLKAPIDQTSDYDRAIKMIEMCVGDIVEINEEDFACYVMDDWSWKKQFLTTNAFYTKV